MKQIYLDHHATTPLDPDVLEAMMPFFKDEFGNPSSNTHAYGQNARKAVDRAREQVAALVGANKPDEIIFTSGATESDNLALKGVATGQCGKNIVTLPIEHKAILDPAKVLQKQGVEVRYARINEEGMVDLDHLGSIIDDNTVLVSIQTANGEIGTLQPVTEIARLSKAHGALFHTDAVQSLGRLAVQVAQQGIDMLSASAHKIYGPKGVGALYVRRGIKLNPLINGGGQERGLRSGTLNVPGIVGMGKAAELARKNLKSEADHCRALQQALIEGIEKRIERVRLNGPRKNRLPHNVNFAFAGIEGQSLILFCRQFALSSTSACTSGAAEPSYVLKAIGLGNELARSSIRIGLGKGNTMEHIELLIDTLEMSAAQLRSR